MILRKGIVEFEEVFGENMRQQFSRLGWERWNLTPFNDTIGIIHFLFSSEGK
jgi:hypothetical protein